MNIMYANLLLGQQLYIVYMGMSSTTTLLCGEGLTEKKISDSLEVLIHFVVILGETAGVWTGLDGDETSNLHRLWPDRAAK